LIVRAKPLGRIDLRRRPTVANDVFKHQTITANIRESLATRNNSNAIATVLESGCIERPDDACAIYQYLHRCLLVRECLTLPAVRSEFLGRGRLVFENYSAGLIEVKAASGSLR
jgi:hypothetical protein